ncbi:uncharacterized protein TNCV_1018611 [Trichonephila clavipes]|nr:uncharacterized protein TNCV_1018611 [Trichonephila clavipes]
MAQHRPRKSAPVEYTTDEEDMIVYDAEDELESNPNYRPRAFIRTSNFLGGRDSQWYRYQIVARLVTSSSPIPLKTRRVGQRLTLNMSRAETSSHWCGVVVRRGGASSGVTHVT